ncbi:hypothetical protein SAMN05216420_10380 [Nitrosospira sp. Nl5]|uniref:hypothetical protein n=1 Tax=Nitrosospira sp. Nl5 TaxID=200120 RepID=UPI0008837268|nr:hypothetical protein [Nitrosospira sp. Nl5]SCY17753.1 hypothetical protein SAMN05216420_10380 [Nitrosospira sp. Nl5]
MALRKELFLVLVLALSFVPVFQAAHALTHVAHTDTISTTQADTNQGESDTDADKICLDCLALTAFSIILPILAIFFFGQTMRQRLLRVKSRQVLRNLTSPYLTRAPPRA